MSLIVVATTRSVARRLLAGALLVCLTLGAVPALAHCCADRCHDAEPLPAAGHCDCTLSGVELPVDLIPGVPETDVVMADASASIAVLDADPPRTCPAATPDADTPLPAADGTVVLRI